MRPHGLPKDANRLELFKAAGVPKIINIHVDEIHDENGAIIAPRQTISVYSSDRKSIPVTIRLDEDTLTWLMHAMQQSWGDAVHEEDPTLHDSTHSHFMTHAEGRVVCKVEGATVILQNRDNRQQMSFPRANFGDPDTIEDSVRGALDALLCRSAKRRRSAGSSDGGVLQMACDVE